MATHTLRNTLVLAVAALSAMLVFAPAAHADDDDDDNRGSRYSRDRDDDHHGDRGRHDDRYDRDRYDHRYDDRYRHDRRHHDRRVYDKRGWYYDSRWRHYRYYPPRGYVYPVLPYGAAVVRHYGSRYWYGGGVWYAPRGSGYAVVAPPLGVLVSFLPSFYSTVWFGGIPYYYANEAYYLWRERERAYEVVEPPAGARASTAPPATEDVFAYPRAGQRDEQVAQDRYECHRWAADATGFDPTRADGGVPAEQSRQRREEYLRAITACLEGRGYSVT